MSDRRRDHEEHPEDTPIYSRLFVVCEKKYTKDDFTKAFSKFGTIDDIKIPRDDLGAPKGVAYIKFAKTSFAAKAMELMNNKCLNTGDRELKIMVAANRSDIQKDKKLPDKYNRLFITVPKKLNEDEISEIFGAYGYVESVSVLRDRDSGDSRGFAYVQYKLFSQAATAFEDCPKQYRPIFAQPRQIVKSQARTEFENNINNLAKCSNDDKSPDLMPLMGGTSGPIGYTKVIFMCCPSLTDMHIGTLFDIVPGKLNHKYSFDSQKNCGRGIVKYANPVSAAYAVKKLNDFEYPPGSKIFVNPCRNRFEENNYNKMTTAVIKLEDAMKKATYATPDLAKLAQAVAEASKIMNIATAGVSDGNTNSDLNYCSVKLPPPKPLADIDSRVAKRCFLVCKPQPPPLTVLRDIFCRFGDLISVYTLPNKTVGYARYAFAAAAEEAIKVLHGAEVCGVRMKVLEADEECPPKRARFN